MKQSSLELERRITALERELVYILVLQGEFRRAENHAREVLVRAGAPGDRWDQADWDQAVAHVRAALGKAFDTAWEEGRTMTTEQAIVLALEKTEAGMRE